MKISKYIALKVLAKFLCTKFGYSNLDESTLSLITSSLQPIIAANTFKLISAGIFTNDDKVDIAVLKLKINELFSIAPILNFPCGNFKLVIKRADAEELIRNLEAFAEKDNVICLPCGK